jgi:hypothetical protein
VWGIVIHPRVEPADNVRPITAFLRTVDQSTGYHVGQGGLTRTPFCAYRDRQWSVSIWVIEQPGKGVSIGGKAEPVILVVGERCVRKNG